MIGRRSAESDRHVDMPFGVTSRVSRLNSETQNPRLTCAERGFQCNAFKAPRATDDRQATLEGGTDTAPPAKAGEQ